MAYLTTVVLNEFTLQSDCLDFMFGQIAGRLDGEKLQDFKEAVYSREDTASTYIEDGLAVPHGRVAGLPEDMVVVGLSRRGIDWPEEDRKAHIVVLIGIDRAKVSAYLALLQKIIKWRKSISVDFDNFNPAEIGESLKKYFQ